MVDGVFGSLTAIQNAISIIGYFKNLDTTVKVDEAVSKLQKEILAAYREQLALVETNQELKTKITEHEDWKETAKAYELKSIGHGALVYMLIPSARGKTPPHWVCQNCYSKRKITIIQSGSERRQFGYACPECKSVVNPSAEAFERDPTGIGNELVPNALRWLD